MRIGIDLGGTKTELAAIDDDGTLLVRRRVPTPSHDYRAIIDVIAKLVTDVEAELGARASVGVATPGALSPRTGLIKNANTVCLNGQPLDRDLEQALQRPVLLANDANCFALSEAVDGAAASARTVFGVILGTGTGGGIAVERSLLTGRNAIAGEWGHNPLPWPREDERQGPPCYCGKSGCIETYVSGPGLARDYHAHTGAHADAGTIAIAAAQGDRTAVACLERYVDRLARALASVINVLDPDVVVFGGGLSNLELIYRELPQRLPSYVFSDGVETPLRKAAHGDSSGVRGAAWLWPK